MLQMKKKIIYQAFALALTLSLSSCFSDDSTLGDDTIGEITVSGIADSYSNVAYMGEYLTITPQVESKEDMTYTWLLLNDKTGTEDANGNQIQPEVIGNEKDLHYEVNIAPGKYQVRLEAKGKSGYTVYKKVSLTVRTTFSQGFYVLKENKEGNTDLDLLTLDGKSGNDILTTMDGNALKGKPMSLGIQYNAYYVNPDDDQMTATNLLYVTTESGQFRGARTTDMKSVFDRSNVKYDEMSDSEYPYLFCSTEMYNTMMTNKGIYKATMVSNYSGASTGQYGMPKSECCASRYAFSDVDAMGGGVFWDEKNHSLMMFDYGLAVDALRKSDMSGEELTQGLSNYDCLACGYNKLASDATGVFVLRDNATSKRYLYLTEGSFFGISLSNRQQIRENSHAAKASYYGMNGITASYLYCVDAGHLYAMNFADTDQGEVELMPEGIASDETINFVANQFWNPAFSSGDHFDYLIVGTQKGDAYKLYFYNTNGGAPQGKPVMTMEGKGKVKSVRYVNTDYNVHDSQFGYLTFNSND